MRPRVLLPIAALAMTLALAPPLQAAGDGRVTIDNAAGNYVRYDGGTDATMQRCSTGHRQQNEPTVAVDPSSSNVVVAGSNDYCASIVNGEVWTGYYRSTDGGATWTNSLLPGYPNDTSEAGLASPLHGTCGAAGDPTQTFDADGNLFYGFICFNRSKPINGGVYVAKYTAHGSTYDRTTLVKRGTPSGQFQAGLFQDKINLTVDQTEGEHGGNVYVAWSQYNAFAPTNGVLFSRSTDGGVSFDRPFRVTPAEHGTASFTDLAVGPDGHVWLTYLTYASSSRPTTDVWLLSPRTVERRSRLRCTSRRSPASTRTCSPGAPAASTAATGRSPARAGTRSPASSATRPWQPTRPASTSCGPAASGTASRRCGLGPRRRHVERRRDDRLGRRGAPVDARHRVGGGHDHGRLLRLTDRPGLRTEPPAGEHGDGHELRQRGPHVGGRVRRRRRDVVRDPGHHGREQLRLADPRLASGRLLGRLHLHLGGAGRGERRVDGLA